MLSATQPSKAPQFKFMAVLLVALAWAGVALGSGFHSGEYYTSYTGQATAGATLTDGPGVAATMPSALVRLEEGISALGGLHNYTTWFQY
ncbi:MAG: hypothetical protein OEZ59_07125, partial [Deltaproteobacteria bacterium]|nr:hypothetical protein [Deltaproteobacteria bacterium]